MSRILTEREVNQYSPLALAFLGDSVYEKLVRECIVLSANMPASKLHDLKVKGLRFFSVRSFRQNNATA